MPLRRHRITAIALALVALLAAAPVWAQSADDLEEVEEQQDQLDEQLDVLQADHAELEAALEATNTRVRQQEAAKREAEQRLEVARAEVRAAQAAVTEMRAEITDLRGQADEDAVTLYMNPDPTLAVMDAGDLTTATRREAVLSTIASNHSDVLDRLGGLEIDLVEAEARSVTAAREVEVERAAVQARLEEYQSTQAEQQRLENALEARIADVEAEAEALAEEEAAIRAALAQASQAPVGPGGSIDTPPSANGLVWPASGTITGVFGEDRGDHIHAGIDIANASGTPIYAANSGTVIGGCGGGYGNCVLIDHGDGMVTLYAHQTSIFVGSGQSVTRGQQIGTMGCTGSCTGPHLHFEVRINGTPYDPQAYL
jgi:murein DD-endopeptidase MepM/ murein hydrolase activator NlpD